MLTLKKVAPRPHLSTLVASSISREIAEGRLKPGDQLPTEAALSKTFGVSRNVIREAIAQLRSDGRIWSQQGRGAFVAEAEDTDAAATVLRIDMATSSDLSSLRDLFEFRSIIECQTAALAARRRSEPQLADIRAALKTMESAPYGSVRWLTTDFEFHRRIAVAARNTYIEQFLSFLSEHVRDSILAAGNKSRSDDMARITLDEHRRILDAIEAGDADGAFEAMQVHILGAANRVGL